MTRTPYRTATAGSLRAEHAGQSVTLSGWVARRRDHGGVTFVDLRDASGYVQVVLREADAHNLRAEYCVRVEGTVGRRPAGNENPELPTGEIEVTATALEVLSESAPLPFPIDGQAAGEVGEEARLKYRYLDLRRAVSGGALRLRSKANQVARNVLIDEGFVEVETPTLTRSTPEGARDFLVPVRLQPGNWYALPQSPQLFKQLLMVAGMEKYFQIARCYRDEDFRADRQPEFTQLDIELSFVQQDDVIALGERVLAAVWRELAGYEIPLPMPRMTYAEAMTRFGSDRPDLRFGVELVDLTGYFAGTEFRVFQADHVGAVVMPGGAAQTRKELDAWQEWARARGARGLAYVLLDPETGEARGPVAKNLNESHLSGLADAVGAKPGDAVFFAAGERPDALQLLGAARLEIGKRCELIDESKWEFLWVVDFPMFDKVTGDDGTSGWTAVHHPFTAPSVEFADTFQDNPGEALSYGYDVVLNGTELGGGSVRIHRAEMQQRVFDVLGLTEEDAKGKFGFLLEAFQYGPPPHAGIAIGWDRLTAMLAGSETIRDVIAFPKTASGGDPLTGAPTAITAQQRREAGIDGPPKPGAAAQKPAAGTADSSPPAGGPR